MAMEEFASLLSGICSRSALVPGRPLVWTIIANPKAGGFTIKSRWNKHHAILLDYLKKAEKNPLRDPCSPSRVSLAEGNNFGLIPTKAKGHAQEITNGLVREAASNSGERPLHLIITAGGDGTSLEVMTGLYHAPEEIRRNFVILRLPLGTGNDGADSNDLDKALDLIIEPAFLKQQRALRLKTASGKGPFLAFNILSVGADAFVTHMTNKMKGKMPGDSYKLWVDIAALFYDLIYKVDYMDLKSLDEHGKEVKAFREKLLLLAVGESGRRSYGSHKWVLPDDRNVCAVKQMPVFRKIIFKGKVVDGKHISLKESMLWNANSVEFSGLHPILAQMDGETVLLEKGDFPAVIELSKPEIPILGKA